MTDTELEQLNHAIAAIAGYTNIKHLDTSRNQEIQPKKKRFVGTNKKHPDRVRYIPDYVTDLNVIWHLFDGILGLSPCLIKCQGEGYRDVSVYDASCLLYSMSGETPAIALCKLLVAIYKALKVNP
jgi:hypothetical protein